MARDDWYRNKSWNDEIEATFRAKLARARSMRPQYLVIQAGMISGSHPDAAIGLVDEYLGEFCGIDYPTAQCVRADAHLAKREIIDAVDAFKCALEWEGANPGVTTGATLCLARLVVEQELTEQYDFVWNVLHDRKDRIALEWPANRYDWHGCCALILAQRGDHSQAKEHAEAALEAARETQSPFRHHRGLGLVNSSENAFRSKLKNLAKPRFWHRLIRG